VGTSLGLEMFLEIEAIKGVDSGCGLKNDMATPAAVTPIRPAPGYVFFSSKTCTTVAAVSGLNGNQRFIHKFHGIP
jgi:hypothetical protein